MRTNYPSFWAYFVVVAFMHISSSLADVDAYGNYIPGTPTTGYVDPSMGRYPTTTMNPMMGSGIAPTMSPGSDPQLKQDSLAIEAATAALSQSSGTPSAGLYATQGVPPPLPPSGYATGTAYGPSGPAMAGTAGFAGGQMTQGFGTPVIAGMPFAGTGSTVGGTIVAPTMLGMGSMGAQETYDLFTQIIDRGTIAASNDPDFNDACQQLEDAFVRCDFSQVAAAGDSGLSSTMLAQSAVKAIKVLVNSIVNGWDMIQKTIADIALTELDATEKTSNVNRWKTAAYMLAAAASNTSFRKELATETLKDAAPTFWTAVDKVFSIQPVSLRKKDGTGRFVEVTNEQQVIQDLFRVTQQLTEAISHDGVSSGEEEAKFITGTRAFTNILIRPAFANGSIGLQIFAFRIFNEGILKRLKDFGVITARHDELWCVTAEAFNVMYSGIVGPAMMPARKPAGVNRANGFGTDHIVFNYSKGSMAQSLRGTYLSKYDTNLKKIADSLIKRVSAVGKIGNMISKSASDLLVLMMCSEASEYIMNVSSAADAANLINYFYERGFSFNNRYANWDELTPQAACWTIIILDRLMQKTATSRLTTALGISGARNSLYGDYTSPDIYQGLQQAFTTIAAAKAKFPQANTKLAQLAGTLRSDSTELRKYMLAKKELKTLRARTPVFVIDRVDTSMIGLPAQTATIINTGTVPGYAPQMQAPMAPGRMVTPAYATTGYAASPPRYGATAPAVYGPQPQIMSRPVTSYGAPSAYPAGYTTGYAAPGQQRYATPMPVRAY